MHHYRAAMTTRPLHVSGVGALNFCRINAFLVLFALSIIISRPRRELLYVSFFKVLHFTPGDARFNGQNSTTVYHFRPRVHPVSTTKRDNQLYPAVSLGTAKIFVVWKKKTMTIKKKIPHSCWQWLNYKCRCIMSAVIIFAVTVRDGCCHANN